MEDYYSTFGLKRNSSQNRLVLKLGDKIRKVPGEQPIPEKLMVAFRIFLNPTLKKYYDHWIQSPNKYNRLGQLITRKERLFKKELADGEFPRWLFDRPTFWKLSWSNYLLVVFAVDFNHFGLGVRDEQGNLRPIDGKSAYGMGVMRFFMIYGIPLLLLEASPKFIYLLLLIVLVRALQLYPKLKVDYYRTMVENKLSEWGMDYKL